LAKYKQAMDAGKTAKESDIVLVDSLGKLMSAFYDHMVSPRGGSRKATAAKNLRGQVRHAIEDMLAGDSYTPQKTSTPHDYRRCRWRL
jgi:hypothetical protein